MTQENINMHTPLNILLGWIFYGLGEVTFNIDLTLSRTSLVFACIFTFTGIVLNIKKLFNKDNK